MMKRVVGVLVSCVFAVNAVAQESVTSSLDECINSEKLSNTVKGAAVGAAAGILGSLIGGKKHDAGKAALIGGAAGGALGYATAYYKAAGTCMQMNPSWVPESNIRRSASYQAVIKEFAYKSNRGDLAVVRPLRPPQNVRPGSTVELKTRFAVLTPDGGEARVRIGRKLFTFPDGKEEAVPFMGKGDEERTVENGEYEDIVNLPIPSDATSGTKLRFEFVLSLKNATPVSQTVIFEVN